MPSKSIVAGLNVQKLIHLLSHNIYLFFDTFFLNVAVLNLTK